MHLIRRAALRAASRPHTALISSARSITTVSPFLRVKPAAITPSFVRRYNSEAEDSSFGAVENADGRETRSAFSSPVDEREFTPETIYVGNLFFEVTDDDLVKEFSQFGPIKKAWIATDHNGTSRGFGSVEFENAESAASAIESKNQTIFEGRRMVVNQMAKPRDRPSNPPSKTLFIGNLAYELSDGDLNKVFRDVRNVFDVRVAIDRRTGQPRGFAHADFTDVESATAAMEALKGTEIYGRVLKLDYSAGLQARPDRDGGGGGDRRSYGGDRGGDRPSYGGDRGGDRPSYGGNRGGDRPSYGGDRDGGRSFGGDRGGRGGFSGGRGGGRGGFGGGGFSGGRGGGRGGYSGGGRDGDY